MFQCSVFINFQFLYVAWSTQPPSFSHETTILENQGPESPPGILQDPELA